MKRMFAANRGAGQAKASDDASPQTGGGYDDKQAKLEYVHQMLLELRRLAAGVEEPTLVYLLEMAAEHARDLETDRRFRNAIMN